MPARRGRAFQSHAACPSIERQPCRARRSACARRDLPDSATLLALRTSPSSHGDPVWFGCWGRTVRGPPRVGTNWDALALIDRGSKLPSFAEIEQLSQCSRCLLVRITRSIPLPKLPWCRYSHNSARRFLGGAQAKVHPAAVPQRVFRLGGQFSGYTSFLIN